MSNEQENFKPLSFDDDENFKPLSFDDDNKKIEDFVPISDPVASTNINPVFDTFFAPPIM